jgi:hypothetical protein
MLFYHFTQLRRLESIREQGLKPMPEEQRNFIWPLGDLSPDNVVWLTAQPIMPVFFTAYDIDESQVPDVRITVELAPKNRKLHNWKAWLRKHMPGVYAGDDEPRDNVWESYWFYEGTIKKFVAVEAVDLTMQPPFYLHWHREFPPDDDEAPGSPRRTEASIP